MPNNHTTVGAYCIRPIFAALLLICATAFAQQKTKNVVTVEVSYTDPRDKQTYKIEKIGAQFWMAKNLNYAAEGSRCYKDSTAYCTQYGRLYNWETAKTACPEDFHLPSIEEWKTLVNFAGGDSIAGKKLKAEDDWHDYKGKPGYGTDDYGFSARPGGVGGSKGSFGSVGDNGYWWSSSESDSSFAYNQYITSYGIAKTTFNGKDNLFSVRCVKDSLKIQSIIDANMPEVQNIKRIYGKHLGKEPNATLILAIAPSGELKPK